MIIFPAVDIKSGKCVRLIQGKIDSETVFSNDPVQMAKRWENEGATWIHVVDLDGAFTKSPKNSEKIKQIIETVDASIQIGGGIRTKEVIETYLNWGAARVIIGTEAIRNPDSVKSYCKEYPNQIAIGIDARDGMVSVEGWTETTQISAIELIKQFEDQGVSAIIFTDIHRDGMQSGPNIAETQKVAQTTSIPVIASGGVSTIHDIQKILPLKSDGVIGVITGRALYTGTLSLKNAIQIASNESV